MTTPTTTPTTAGVPLTTGWEPALADDDSLCLRWLRHWAATCAAFAGSVGGTVTADERHLLAHDGRSASFFNAAVLLAPVDDLAALLDEVEARTAGTRTVYLWSLWPTPDLRGRGWELEGHPPLLARPPLAVLPAPAPPPGPDPAPVRTPAGLAAWERVVIDGYPLAGVSPGELAGPSLLDDGRVRLHTSGDAVSAQFVAHGVASFAMGVTLPAARRGGHWYRHAHLRLRAAPELWHVGVFSDDSRHGAERLGFVPVLRHTLWRRSRQENP